METLINHTTMCSLIYYGNLNEAANLLDQHFNEDLVFLNFNEVKLYILSLNLSIYNYILIKENISLYKCCLMNLELINNTYDFGGLRDAGHALINSYGFCSDYLIEKHENPHIKKAIQFIHEHLSEPLTLEKIALYVNINASYLSTLFKSCTGYRINDYINKRRITISKNLLAETHLPLDLVATQCGFNNYPYFCTIFKKSVGICPSAFRAQTKFS